jgi:predicted secreted hydrolase
VRFITTPARALVVLLSMIAAASADGVEYPDVERGRPIVFPDDEGSHPAFRTEWWYITGWLTDEDDRPLGFQVTFFRSRPGLDEANPSQFAPRQLLFAHAAISDPRRGELKTAERSARAGFGLAEAAEQRLDVRLDGWSLRRDGDVYRAIVSSHELSFELEFCATQSPLLQGDAGFSQKGPSPLSASYYYSLPRLSVRGSVFVAGGKRAVRGEAWFDHEWSSSIMDESAAGWDWAGINLDDGGALMMFQMRGAGGGKHWAAATLRSNPNAAPQTFAPEEIVWEPLRHWRSPRTGVVYPVAWRVRVGARVFKLTPLFDDQENDARGSTGTLYWEGAVQASDEHDRSVGRGYLELTGYSGKPAVR